jgi:hypothetical protein
MSGKNEISRHKLIRLAVMSAHSTLRRSWGSLATRILLHLSRAFKVTHFYGKVDELKMRSEMWLPSGASEL